MKSKKFSVDSLLNNYEINNLEKLRSFESFVRCAIELLSNDEVLNVIKDVSFNSPNKFVFNGVFPTCKEISKFMGILTKRINTKNGNRINSSTCRPLLKLEVEFLKNWLIDNGDEYCTVLDYIYKSNKNLWHYSAKIFKYIDQKLDLMSIVQTRLDEKSSIQELKNLDIYFCQSSNETQKIQRIMINRINSYLLNYAWNENAFENINERNEFIFKSYLNKYFHFFQTEIYTDLSDRRFTMIISIASLKTYLQIYAFSLSEDHCGIIMDNIDRLLKTTESPFCSTLKIFIIKSLCQIYGVDLDRLYEKFVNCTCDWIKTVFSNHQYQQERNSRESIILPTPLFQAKEEYIKVNKILKDELSIQDWNILIDNYSTNQQLSYCFIMSFVQQYAKVHTNATSNNKLKTTMKNLNSKFIECFELIGYKFLHLLCNNFDEKTYFQLNKTITQDELHRRLLALNIFALFLSYKTNQNFTLFNYILFDECRKMPHNYSNHLKTICLPGLTFDDQNHTDQENNTPRLGYPSMKSAELSNIHEKSDHLKLSISYRFFRMISHAILLILHELDLLDTTYQRNRDYCRDHFEKDYELTCQLFTEPDQCYIWLYKLISHLVDADFKKNNSLNHYQNVIEFEKYIENQFIIPHIGSIRNEIREYKLIYNEYVKQQNNDLTMYELVDELVHDENKYPLLSFFNITNNHIINRIDSFYAKLQIIPDAEMIYPMTMFFLKRFDDYANIQCLHPIITFVDYLRQKFNCTITRKNAEKKMIEEVLFKDSDNSISWKLYNSFIKAWYQLNFREVYLDSQPIKFERKYPLEEFRQRTEICKLFINSAKDSNSLLLIACIKTISDLQNKIVQHFHDITNSGSSDRRIQLQTIPLQSLQVKHLLSLDKDIINRKLIDDASVINYAYGMGKDIIYDFEEIEFMIREKISRLPLIDTDSILLLNYQFELYEENASLITNVRRNCEQKAFDEQKRRELQSLIDIIPNDDILHYIGSLDQIFTYLRDCERNSVNNLTIKTFIQQHILSKTALCDKLFQNSNFSNIELPYIIAFYQLLEEIGFEKILRNHIENDSRGSLLLSVDDETYLIDQFIQMTSGKITIATCFKNLDCWISMLKRLLLRITMNANLSFDEPLRKFAARSDFWTVNVTANDIQSFEIADDIQLRHAFIILKCLEERNRNSQGERRSNATDQRSNIGSSISTRQAWFPSQTPIRNQREVIGSNVKTAKKTKTRV